MSLSMVLVQQIHISNKLHCYRLQKLTFMLARVLTNQRTVSNSMFICNSR